MFFQFAKIFMLLPLFFSINSGVNMAPEKNFTDIFKEASAITIYVDGKVFEADVEQTNEQFFEMLKGSYYAPAFGVSIHSQTTEAMQKGYWIEFHFEKQSEFAGLPYSKLLIELKPEYYGFNVIRYNNEEYTGRCFYINLSKTSTDFYNYIVNYYSNLSAPAEKTNEIKE